MRLRVTIADGAWAARGYDIWCDQLMAEGLADVDIATFEDGRDAEIHFTIELDTDEHTGSKAADILCTVFRAYGVHIDSRDVVEERYLTEEEWDDFKQNEERMQRGEIDTFGFEI